MFQTFLGQATSIFPWCRLETSLSAKLCTTIHPAKGRSQRSWCLRHRKLRWRWHEGGENNRSRSGDLSRFFFDHLWKVSRDSINLEFQWNFMFILKQMATRNNWNRFWVCESRSGSTRKEEQSKETRQILRWWERKRLYTSGIHKEAWQFVCFRMANEIC